MTFSDNARGILLMCGAMLAFTLNDTLVKAVLQDGMNLYQVITLRGIGAALGLIVLALHQTGRLGLWPAGPDRKFLALRCHVSQLPDPDGMETRFRQLMGLNAAKAGFAEGSPEDLPAARREKYEHSGRRSKVLVKALPAETPVGPTGTGLATAT